MTKYKIGDWVTLVGLPTKHRFHILQIIETTDSGGKYVSYRGRMFLEAVQSFGPGEFCPSDKWTTVGEVEIAGAAAPLTEMKTERTEQ